MLTRYDKSKDKRAFDSETPQHKLYLFDYRIARVPVTVAQFRKFFEATSYTTTAEPRDSALVWTGLKLEEVKGQKSRLTGHIQLTCQLWRQRET